MPPFFTVFYVVLQSNVQQIELPIKRSKGASGIIEVYWSLHSNESADFSKLIWPSSGKIRLLESEWNATLLLNAASNEMETKEQVILVEIVNATGGAILASRNLTQTNLIIASNLRQVSSSNLIWIISGSAGALCFILLMVLVLFVARRWCLKVGVKGTETETETYVYLY
jgi:hypothetical protein